MIRKFVYAAALASAYFTLPARALEHVIGTVRTDQVVLGYETYGKQTSALPLIVVNGGPGLDHRYMTQNKAWQPIAKDRLVVFYDQRGTGTSRHMSPDAAQTMDAEVADLDAIRAKLGLQKIALLGHSWGGMIVMAYATAHPDRVERLILCDSVPATWKAMKGKSFVYYNFYPDVRADDDVNVKSAGTNKDAVATTELIDQLHTIFYSSQKREKFLANLGKLGYTPSVSGALDHSTANIDLRDAISTFQFPVLVITGRYDTTIEPVVSWDLAHQIPGARLVFMEKSGHFSFYEEPDKFDHEVRLFLK
jgi:proline iminopeptidase